MKSPFECRKYAEECRVLANGYDEDRRREVLRIADIYEGSAPHCERSRPRLVFRSDRDMPNRRIESGNDPRRLWAASLQARFDEVAKEPLPARFRDLLDKVARAENSIAVKGAVSAS